MDGGGASKFFFFFLLLVQQCYIIFLPLEQHAMQLWTENREFFGRKSDETCQQIVTNCSLRDVLLNCATERRASKKKRQRQDGRKKRERKRLCENPNTIHLMAYLPKIVTEEFLGPFHSSLAAPFSCSLFLLCIRKFCSWTQKIIHVSVRDIFGIHNEKSYWTSL